MPGLVILVCAALSHSRVECNSTMFVRRQAVRLPDMHTVADCQNGIEPCLTYMVLPASDTKHGHSLSKQAVDHWWHMAAMTCSPPSVSTSPRGRAYCGLRVMF